MIYLLANQVHFRATPTRHPLGMGSPEKGSGSSVASTRGNTAAIKGKEWSMPHEIWSAEEVNNIQARQKLKRSMHMHKCKHRYCCGSEWFCRRLGGVGVWWTMRFHSTAKVGAS